ncbi:MAG TPA: MarR family transcriptional regulator [Devosia sp.]|jgi:DNA-binding MarR family transcriptional regulator|uniref:MarR family winged helix-turn-helix transcriptional regulator n=1 Tax=Devosia sp. TaxID=1871048 RepID=UPI002DDCB8CD|nr:MarR family transcriptional regulator [Devosia sp.]HEV2518536.1 MarR family transcriptional regulator [Devosia sp.]
MDKKAIAEQLKLDVLLCFSAYSLSHAFSRFYRPMLDKLGLTYPQFVVMMVLWENGRITMKALTDLVMLESNTLTPLLKKLEAAGLVKRTRNKDDERVLDIEITEAGLALKADGQLAAVDLALASGEDLGGVIEMQQRMAKMRDNVRAKLEGS